MKKNVLFFLLSAVFVLSLAACGKKMPEELKISDITEETLYIKADGTNQIAYVESFSEKYYSIEELKIFMEAELKPYNKKFGEGVATVRDIILDKKNVISILNFTNNKAYAEFSRKRSDKPVRYPAFSKLMEKYGDTDFNSAKEEGIKKGRNAMNSEEHNVVIVTGPLHLMTEKKIQFYSTGKLLDENNLRLDEGDEAVVVFSR